MSSRRRVLLVTNRYRTYHRRTIETLADAFDFGIVWLSPPYEHDPVPPELLGRMQSWILGDDPRRLTYRDVRRSTALFRLILREGPRTDLVIAPAAAAWKSRVLYAASRAARTAIAFRCDVWREGDGLVRSTKSRGTSGPRARIQRRVSHVLERSADGLLVPGSKGMEFLVGHGIPAEQIFRFPRLHPEISTLPLDPALMQRLEALTAGRPAFLYLGRVMHQKGLVPLVRVFRSILATGRDAVLFVVGGPVPKDIGAGRPSVEYFAEAKQLAAGEPRIMFMGNVDPTLVHNYYAAADVFVHPHVAKVDGQDVFEPWGNVISEAACMSMPIVVSDRIPAGFDLVDDGVSGYRLHAERMEEELPAALIPFIDDRDLVARFGHASRAKYAAFADPNIVIDSLNRMIDRARGAT